MLGLELIRINTMLTELSDPSGPNEALASIQPER